MFGCIEEKLSESGVSVEACAPRRFQPQALLPDAENLALWATFFLALSNAYKFNIIIY